MTRGKPCARTEPHDAHEWLNKPVGLARCPGVSAATHRDVPLYQPGDTKVLRITLSFDEWWVLSERATQTDLTLEQFVNAVVQDAVVNRKANKGGLV